MAEIKDLQNKLRLETTKRLQEVVEDYGISVEIISKMVNMSTKNVYRYLSDLLVIPFKDCEVFSETIIIIEKLRDIIKNNVIAWPIQNNVNKAAIIFDSVFRDRKMLRIFNLKDKSFEWKIKRLLNLSLKYWTDKKEAK